MNIKTKQLTTTALLLAICILSQYFKNISVYITGPIVNTTIILATLSVGLYSGMLLSIISPITAFFFTGSPIVAAIPLMFPVIMIGNLLLVIMVHYFYHKTSLNYKLIFGLLSGSILKSIFMGITVVFILLPIFGNNIASHLPKPEMLPKIIATANITFSFTQLITALLGSILAFLIWLPLQKALKKEL